MPIRLLIFLIAAVVLAGCRSGRNDTARVMDKYLDRNAMEYAVISAPAWDVTWERVNRMLDSGALSSVRLAEDRSFILSGINIFRLCVELSGLRNSGGIGFCSSSVADSPYIRSRVFLALSPQSEGLLNELFPVGGKGIVPAEVMKDIPADSVAAFYADITPAAFFEALRRSGNAGENLASVLPSTLAWDELCRSAAGVWSIVFLKNAEGEMLCRVTLPDNEGAIFKLLSLLGRSPGGSSRVELLNKNDAIICEKSDGKIYVYFSRDTEKCFKASPAGWNISEKYSAMLAGLPEKASMFCFADGTAAVWDGYTVMGLNFPEPDRMYIPCAAAISRNDDGFLLVSNSDTPILTTLISAQMFLVTSAMDIAEGMGEAKKSGKPAAHAKIPASPAAATSGKCSCKENMTAAALLAGSSKKQMKSGFYKIADNHLEPAEKADAQIAYFGEIKSEKTVPVFIAIPHESGFCVLFSDGQIKKYKLERSGSFRRIIGYLQTHCNFDEKIFRELIRIASDLDRQ